MQKKTFASVSKNCARKEKQQKNKKGYCKALYATHNRKKSTQRYVTSRSSRPEVYYKKMFCEVL